MFRNLHEVLSKANLKVSSLFILYSMILAALDLLTKALVYSSLKPHTPVNVIGNWVRFTLVINYRSAFGLSFGDGFPYALSASAIAFILFLVMLWEKRKIYKFLYSTILGGAIGNIVDRIIRGGVVDFLDVGVGNYRWYTFNLADVWVTLGLVGMVVIFFLESELIRSNSQSL